MPIVQPRPFTLYPTSLFTYEDCPQQFLWSKGWGHIDLGRGPGKGKARPVKKSEHHAVLGTAIQYSIERFYNDELWRNIASFPDLRDRLLKLGEEGYQLELRKRFIDWREAPPQDEMREIIRNGILGYLRTMKAHKLIGPYAKAEVELLAYINKWNPIGGRADVIFRRDDTGATIIDGKNSKRFKDPKDKTKWMTFTKPDQLRYYAMLYYLCYHKLPERLGFVFYRFPYGDPVVTTDGTVVPGQIEQGVEWVPCTLEDVKGIAQRAVDARKGMDREKFAATPSPSTCRMCDFETVCPERQAQKAANRRGPRDTDDLLKGPKDESGFVTLNFD
jgi:hypothetical protein